MALDFAALFFVLSAAATLVLVAEPRLRLLARLWGTRKAAGSSAEKPVQVEETKPEKLPDPDPLYEFDLETATTRDHIYVNKTLRYPYFQTMQVPLSSPTSFSPSNLAHSFRAHQPMDINNWVEIDKNYKREMEYKRRIVEKHPQRTIISLPENDAAAGELLRTLVDYLPKRYPTLFQALPAGGIWNKVLNERFPGCASLSGTAALKVVSRLVVDDYLMARVRDDGHVYFVGGVVAIPGFYDFSAKVGKSMYDVHVPVPQFNEKILMSVERTLKRFKPTEPFERSSWEIVDDFNTYEHAIARLEEGEKVRDDLEPQDYVFRIDHQSFRKLPKTQGIIFSVHPVLRRLEEFADLPLVPALLATVHENAPADLMKYKLAQCYQDKMLPYLKQLTQSQIDRGLIKGDEEVSTFRDLLQK
ncbi:hypothetical protein JCM11251_003831 [Rhodosporidiobolus azoricus]